MNTHSNTAPLHPMWVRLRWPLLGLTLAVTIYFALLTGLWPHPGFDFETQPDGTIVVYDPVPGSPAASVLRTGDIIQAVDGWPTTQVADWHWLFPLRNAYTYQIARAGTIFTVEVAVIPMPMEGLLIRLMPYAVALSTALIGALILIYATPRNRAAWRAGIIFLTLSVTLASASGSVYFAPGAFVAFHGLMVLAGVGYAELALYPRAQPVSRPVRIAFAITYAVALALTLLSVYELIVVYPTGREFNPGNWPLSRWRLAGLAVGLIANPVILAVRYGHTPRSEHRQQVRILLVGTLATLLPMLVMVIVPQVLGLDVVALFGPFAYRAPLWFILLLPLTYGYVIYRHRYLQLDLFMTRAVVQAWARHIAGPQGRDEQFGGQQIAGHMTIL